MAPLLAHPWITTPAAAPTHLQPWHGYYLVASMCFYAIFKRAVAAPLSGYSATYRGLTPFAKRAAAWRPVLDARGDRSSTRVAGRMRGTAQAAVGLADRLAQPRVRLALPVLRGHKRRGLLPLRREHYSSAVGRVRLGDVPHGRLPHLRLRGHASSEAGARQVGRRALRGLPPRAGGVRGGAEARLYP